MANLTSITLDGATATVPDSYTKAETDALLDDKAEAVELTQSEYDDLTPEQKEDGTIYFITDGDCIMKSRVAYGCGGDLWGQYEGTTGLYAPSDRDPRMINNYSVLVTDALGMDMRATRALGDVSGFGINLKTAAAAGSTTYQIANTYQNRMAAKMCENGYASRDEATSHEEQIVEVVSVTIGGNTFTPDSSDNSSTPIEITVSESLNPDSSITNIRLFGLMSSYATLYVGNGVSSEGGGRNLLVGGAIKKEGGTNDNAMVGSNMYSSGNGNAMFGRHHIARKNRGFFAGTGHDSTNARSEGASAVGEYSYMDSNTLFAVGNGANHTSRSNAFEVTADGGIILKSPNGTRFKITVDNSGNLTNTQV